MTNKIILNTSPEAASQKTVTGWVSSTGRFWGDDERLARWEGCTHIVCSCGAPVPKTWVKCERCRSVDDVTRHEALPLVEWDGEAPFCLDDGDEYFFDVESFYDWCDHNGSPPSEVRLVLAEPEYYHPLHAEYWVDVMPEDGDLPDEIQAAVDALNKVVAEYKKPACWTPGKQRIVMPNQYPGL